MVDSTLVDGGSKFNKTMFVVYVASIRDIKPPSNKLWLFQFHKI